ncbi:MAG: phosphonate C-P lyase system protein PhnL [Hyphomicrobiales bacterium]|nr:MAG: phosphonate C-P lyase system protein PhnL [Hyphomicrobiales bacterium]
MNQILRINDLCKSFVLHTQGGTKIDVFSDLNLELSGGEAIAITGPSGMGKSSLLKIIYGSYKSDSGEVLVKHQDEWCNIPDCSPREMIALREAEIGYVSQFLRVIPRVSTLDIVAEPILHLGKLDAEKRAGELLERLNIPQNLWQLSPTTFSGGEQQRVNIARGFAKIRPLLLLDEPTASLDAINRAVVLDMINEARLEGSAILGVYHNIEDREKVSSGECNLANFREAA